MPELRGERFGSCLKDVNCSWFDVEIWIKAVNTACYLSNHSPTSATRYEIPEEVWTGNLLIIIFFEHILCDAYDWILKEQRHKKLIIEAQLILL